MAKQTKAQRVETKVAGGLTHIEAEIEVEQEDARARIARLRQRQTREGTKVREIVVDLLESEHSELFGQLSSVARRQLKTEAQRRRARAKKASASADAESCDDLHRVESQPTVGA
ncbi:MAG: hypothetical protein ACTH0N_12050 [Brevibacterium aurantiacum]